MVTYTVDIRDIFDEVGSSIDIEDRVPLDVLIVGDNEFASRGDVEFRVSVSNIGSGFALLGTAALDAVTQCSRCVCDFPLRLEGDVEGLFLRRGQEADDAEEPGTVSQHGTIDIGAALTAALVAEAPFVPLHDEKCEGLCPVCGADLNVETCECDTQPDAANPFAVLQVLVDDDSGDS